MALKAAVQAAPAAVGIHLADWNWKVVREFVQQRFRILLGRSSCLNYLHRLGFVLKRPNVWRPWADLPLLEELTPSVTELPTTP